MAYTIRNRFASINHNDREGVRVTLERTVRNGRVVWVESENPDVIVADGRNATEADAALRYVYSDREWGLKMGQHGTHRLKVRG